MANEERQLLEQLEELDVLLKKEVVGQEHAVEAVAGAVVVAAMKVCDPERPLGTFLFLGPSGVGKSQLPRSLAKILHGGEKAVVSVNCTEFKNPHDVAKLVGAPPGYVGHERMPFLTPDKLINFLTVVVFEELEKADPALFDLFLQMLDRGELKTGLGIDLNFKNCLIFMTSNEGTWEADKLRRGRIGLAPPPITPEDANQITADTDNEEKKIYRQAVENTWRPEFINRFDEIIVFHRLQKKHFELILDKFLLDVRARFAMAGMGVTLSSEAKDFLVLMGTSLRYGARPLRRAIQKHLTVPLARFGLKCKNSGQQPGNFKVDFDKESNRLVFKKVETTLAANGN